MSQQALNTYSDVAKYIQSFLSLNINEYKGERSPHKPLLILSVIRLIEDGVINENKIPPIEALKLKYELLWDKYILHDTSYAKAVWTPYWHLYNEPFWHFKPINTQASVDTLIEESKGQTASIGKIRSIIEYAYFDEELFKILQQDSFRTLLKSLLIDTYLK